MTRSMFFLLLILGCTLCRISAQENSTETASRKEDDSSGSGTSNTEASTDDPNRTKRDGSGLGGIFSSIFQKKLGLIGSLSSISSSSSNSGKNIEVAAPPPSKPFDWGSIKRSIFSSILQAVKAIAGGVIALNGQLVKVKGHLIAAKGNLVASKGDSISNFGRNLATNAFGPVVREAPTDTPGETSPIPGFGESGPAAVQSSFEHGGFPSHFLSKGINYPGFFKPSGYAKRAAPVYHVTEDTISKRQL